MAETKRFECGSFDWFLRELISNEDGDVNEDGKQAIG